MQLRKVAELSEGYGNRLAFAPDGETWAAASPFELHLFRGSDPAASLELPPEPTDRVTFAADGRRLFVAPLVLELASRSWVELPPIGPALTEGSPPLDGGELTLTRAAVTPDGELLLACAEYRPGRRPGAGSGYAGPRSRILALDAGTRAVKALLHEADGWETPQSAAASERYLAAASASVWSWERAELRPAGSVERDDGYVRALRFGPADSWLAGVGAGGELGVWSVDGLEQRAAWQAHTDDAYALDAHPSSDVLASGGTDGRLCLWTADGELLQEVAVEGEVEGVALAAGKAAVAVDGERLDLYDLA